MRLTLHGERDTVEELKTELPDGVSWTEYLLECVRMRKRVEGRELVLAAPENVDTIDRVPEHEKREK